MTNKQLKKQIKYLIKKNNELESELIKIYNSKTWRLIFLYKKIISLVKNKLKIRKIKNNNFYNFILKKGYFTKNQVIGITHTYWTGVYHATLNQCKYVICFNNEIQKEDVNEIIKLIKKLKINKIAINGILDGIEILLNKIFKIKNLDVYLIWHGSLTQQTIEDHISRFNKIKKYLNKFEKIAFLKKEIFEVFKKCGYKSFYIPNTFNQNIKISDNKIKNNENLKNKTINIGILGWWSWHKNNLNQIISASLVKNVKIHTLYYPDNIYYLRKITEHKITNYYSLTYDETLKLISKMDILLNVSLTECYPNILLESFYFSKPILLGKFADQIIEDEFLKKILIVNNPEDIEEIKNKITFIIKNYEDITKNIRKYYKKLILKNNEKIINFFNNK